MPLGLPVDRAVKGNSLLCTSDSFPATTQCPLAAQFSDRALDNEVNHVAGSDN